MATHHPPGTPTDLPIKRFATRQSWLTWLDRNHATSPGVYVMIAKKGSTRRSVTFADALEVALCYGWIDSMGKSYDDEQYVQRFTPRRAKSKWSKINRQKVTDLIERGLMRPAGLREVEAAKADGRWDAAYDSPSTATVPDDLQRALNENTKAKDFFATLSAANRFAILHRIQDAKRPETRARRIDRFVQMLANGETIY